MLAYTINHSTLSNSSECVGYGDRMITTESETCEGKCWRLAVLSFGDGEEFGGLARFLGVRSQRLKVAEMGHVCAS
jgi:hypothetical protein